MKQRSLFRRFLDKVRGAKPAVGVVAPESPLTKPSTEKPPRKRTESSFEPLEGRIAPAVLLNASTVQFTDTTGDLVTIQFSKALFKEGTQGLNQTLDKVFTFLGGGTVRTAADGGSASDEHELAKLDLAILAAAGTTNPANGTSISITAEKQGAAGDDLVNVGYIKAAHSSLFGIALGKVVVDGDLGRIDAGDAKKSVAISSLTVNSWGTLGKTTQIAEGATLESNVTSGIGTLAVLGDYKDAVLRVVNGESDVRHAGKIGKLIIGGDILVSEGNNAVNAGAIATAGSITSITVNDIIGGAGQNSGKISAGKLGTVTLTGDLRGGAGRDSGQIVGTNGIVKIAMDTLWAGAGENSGRITTEESITSITLENLSAHATATGGVAGKNAGSITIGGKLGTLTVTENISGGNGENSGRITVATSITKAVIGGHVIGGAGAASGQIVAGSNIGSLSVDGAAKEYVSVETVAGAAGVQEKQVLRLNEVFGREGEFTLSFGAPGSLTETTVSFDTLATAAAIQEALNDLPSIGENGVTVALQNGNLEITFTAEGPQTGVFTAAVSQASIVGSAGVGSGSVVSNGNLGKAAIKSMSSSSALEAGAGAKSGSISVAGNLGSLLLEGDLNGSTVGATQDAASVQIGGNLGSLSVTGDLLGGGGEFTGAVTAEGSIGSIKINGSLIGGAGESSASIIANGKISSALVTGSLDGGSGANSASLVAGTDITGPSDFGKVTVLGQLLGDGPDSASIRAGGKLGTVVIGTKSSPAGVVVSGGTGGTSANIAGRTGLNSVMIYGSVEGGDGTNSATIQAGLKVNSVKIIGDLKGGEGIGSGSIAATEIFNGIDYTPGNISKVTVEGSLVGSEGNDSGQIRADGSIQAVTVGGLTGFDGDWSGSIVAGRGTAALLDDYRTIGQIGKVVVDGPIAGGTGAGSGSIQSGAKLSLLTVNGSLSGASIISGRDIGSVTINGGLTDALISAQGSAKATSKADLAIAKLTINGDVSNSLIRAGYDVFNSPVNGNAQIGAVKVSGNWIASSIVAGVEDVSGDGFGDADDAVITGGTISRIASIVIDGNVTGTGADGDQFGFVAQTIGSVKIAGAAQALTNGKDTIPLAGTPVTNDTSILEVP